MRLDEVGIDQRPGTNAWVNRIVHKNTRRFVCVSESAENTRKAFLRYWRSAEKDGLVLMKDDKIGFHQRVLIPDGVGMCTK